MGKVITRENGTNIDPHLVFMYRKWHLQSYFFFNRQINIKRLYICSQVSKLNNSHNNAVR